MYSYTIQVDWQCAGKYSVDYTKRNTPPQKLGMFTFIFFLNTLFPNYNVTKVHKPTNFNKFQQDIRHDAPNRTKPTSSSPASSPYHCYKQNIRQTQSTVIHI